MDEARLAARVHHPNVVQTLDVVAAEGELLLVMEYVAAVSLAQLLRAARERREPVPPAIAAAVMAGVLRGLHAAHEATDEAGDPLDIVHRDVSPQNILVGADGGARVIDSSTSESRRRRAGRRR
jgi:serine/threonine-protein kinase